MRLLWNPKAWHDYVDWSELNKKVHKKINSLIKETMRTPFTGRGKPEPLKGDLGLWSRRIDNEHRLVYTIEGEGTNQTLEIISCRNHYK